MTERAPTSASSWPANRVRVVGSFDELVATRFENGINALLWPRNLPGEFGEIVGKVPATGEITSIDEHDLRALDLSPGGAMAREVLLSDLLMLRDLGLDPTLDCIASYRRDDTSSPVARDVHSFHVDSAPVETDTFLCTYFGDSTEGLVNEAAIRRIDDPGTRAKLLQLYGGDDDEGFAAFLAEECFDRHYAPLPGSQPYEFGRGTLCRIAVAYPGASVPPCIHRAPQLRQGAGPRLLLIS